MKKVIFLLILQVLLRLSLYAQDNFAVIKDKDGYTNVRESDMKSKIVGKVYKYVEREGYSRNDKNSTQSGYIHKSRVQKLSDLPTLKKTLDTKNKAVFKNDTISVTFEFAPFDYKGHVLKNSEGKTINQSMIDKSRETFLDLASIDSEAVWGADGVVFPRTEIKSLTISYKDTTLLFPANSLKNLFDPSVYNTKIYIGLDGEIYIWLQGGDGAGGYHVIWVIVGRELKYRYVDLSFYV